MILTKILEEKRIEVEKAKSKVSIEKLLAEIRKDIPARKPHFFKNSISRPGKISLIAEIKKASPSAGVLREDFDPVSIAMAYEAGGAQAVSVLTETKFFLGSLACLKDIKRHVGLPVLRKDFLIDEYQLYESAAAKADAILLIAGLLTEETLKKFMAVCSQLGMDVLAEVHSEEDVGKAVACGCQIIGVNNRDLHTFSVDINTTIRLLKIIPGDKTIVSESGIHNRQDIMYLKSLGINAVLIGEAFMRSEDISLKMKELIG